jgi:hypothetical protein
MNEQLQISVVRTLSSDGLFELDYRTPSNLALAALGRHAEFRLVKTLAFASVTRTGPTPVAMVVTWLSMAEWECYGVLDANHDPRRGMSTVNGV